MSALLPDWVVIPQGCKASPDIRTLIQGPGHQHVLLSSSIPSAVRARLAVAILRELEEIECDRVEAEEPPIARRRLVETPQNRHLLDAAVQSLSDPDRVSG